MSTETEHLKNGANADAERPSDATCSIAPFLRSENESLKKLVKHYETQDALRLRGVLETATRGQLQKVFEYDPFVFDHIRSVMSEIMEAGQQ